MHAVITQALSFVLKMSSSVLFVKMSLTHILTFACEIYFFLPCVCRAPYGDMITADKRFVLCFLVP